MVKPTRRSSGDPSRLSRAALRRAALRFGRNTLGIPPSRALSGGRLAALGAHPGSTTGCYALHLVAGLLGAASERTQVLVGTQSSALVDQFEAKDIIVVENEDGVSRFNRPPADKVERWLEEYSLGEVWEKNIIGGGPH